MYDAIPNAQEPRGIQTCVHSLIHYLITIQIYDSLLCACHQVKLRSLKEQSSMGLSVVQCCWSEELTGDRPACVAGLRITLKAFYCILVGRKFCVIKETRHVKKFRFSPVGNREPREYTGSDVIGDVAYYGGFAIHTACLPFAPADPLWALWSPRRGGPVGSLLRRAGGGRSKRSGHFFLGLLLFGITVGWLPRSTKFPPGVSPSLSAPFPPSPFPSSLLI